MTQTAESFGLRSAADTPRYEYTLATDSALFAEDPGSIATICHLGMQVAMPPERLVPLDGIGLPIERFDAEGHLLGVNLEYAQFARISLWALVRNLKAYADSDQRLVAHAAWWEGNGHALAGATRVPDAPTFVAFDMRAGEIYEGTSAGGMNRLPVKYPRLAV